MKELQAMLMAKLKTMAALAPLIGLTGIVSADEKKPQGPTIHGLVKEVDAGKKKITVTVMVNPATKQTEEKTFPLAQDAKIVLDDRRTKDEPAKDGKLSDLTEGTPVYVQLDRDQKTATGVTAREPGLHAFVKEVDAAGRGITVTFKDKNGASETTLTLAKDAKVLLQDGLSKDEKDKEGALAELTEGTPVLVQQSVDRKTALSIRVLGRSIYGTFRGLDKGNHTITVSVKENGAVVEKTFALDRNATLGDLNEGLGVHLQLSVFDKEKVVAARGHKAND